MSDRGIDTKNGIIHLYEVIPNEGDSVMIVNCGDHLEFRQHSWQDSAVPPIFLTEEEIDWLREGRITWN